MSLTRCLTMQPTTLPSGPLTSKFAEGSASEAVRAAVRPAIEPTMAHQVTHHVAGPNWGMKMPNRDHEEPHLVGSMVSWALLSEVRGRQHPCGLGHFLGGGVTRRVFSTPIASESGNSLWVWPRRAKYNRRSPVGLTGASPDHECSAERQEGGGGPHGGTQGPVTAPWCGKERDSRPPCGRAGRNYFAIPESGGSLLPAGMRRPRVRGPRCCASLTPARIGGREQGIAGTARLGDHR